MPVPDLVPEEIRRVTEEVLSRPEYQENAPGLFAQLLDLVLEWIGRAIEAVIGAGDQSVFGTIVVLLTVAALTLLIIRFASGVRRGAVVDPALAGAAGRAPQEWRAEAEEHERAGRWREALRCRYRLLLARLAERGLVDEVPGRTSGEYLAEAVRALPAAADDLREVTRAFERVWYGRHPADAELVGAVAEGVERIEESAGGGRQRAVLGSRARERSR